MITKLPKNDEVMDYGNGVYLQRESEILGEPEWILTLTKDVEVMPYSESQEESPYSSM